MLQASSCIVQHNVKTSHVCTQSKFNSTLYRIKWSFYETLAALHFERFQVQIELKVINLACSWQMLIAVDHE